MKKRRIAATHRVGKQSEIIQQADATLVKYFVSWEQLCKSYEVALRLRNQALGRLRAFEQCFKNRSAYWGVIENQRGGSASRP